MSFRKLYGLFIGCLTVFFYLFITVYLDYIKTTQAINYVDWDVKTVTAGDYTVELKIENDAYEQWLHNYYDKSNMLTECAQLKIFLRQELENRIKLMDDLGFEAEDMSEDDKCRINQINMAYKNEYIIKKLKERGLLIRDQKYKEVIEMQNQILYRLKQDKDLMRARSSAVEEEQEPFEKLEPEKSKKTKGCCSSLFKKDEVSLLD